MVQQRLDQTAAKDGQQSNDYEGDKQVKYRLPVNIADRLRNLFVQI